MQLRIIRGRTERVGGGGGVEEEKRWQVMEMALEMRGNHLRRQAETFRQPWHHRSSRDQRAVCWLVRQKVKFGAPGAAPLVWQMICTNVSIHPVRRGKGAAATHFPRMTNSRASPFVHWPPVWTSQRLLLPSGSVSSSRATSSPSSRLRSSSWQPLHFLFSWYRRSTGCSASSHARCSSVWRCTSGTWERDATTIWVRN